LPTSSNNSNKTSDYLSVAAKKRNSSAANLGSASSLTGTTPTIKGAAARAGNLPPSNLVTNTARKYISNAIGYRVLYDINQVSTILPTALVGAILFTQYGRGIRDSELISKIKWLRRQVILRGGRVQMAIAQEEGLPDYVMAVVNQVLYHRVCVLTRPPRSLFSL